MKFASQLSKWREAQKLSQSEAAKRLGVNLRTLQNWEQERNKPKRYAQDLISSKYFQPDTQVA